jgi:hypothetical protein
MTSATVTSLDGVLKVYYDDMKVKLMQYGESTFLATLPRMTKFTGKNLPIPILFSTPAGRGTTIAKAQAAAAPARTTDFALTRAKDYGVVTIDNEALEASEGEKGAFVSARVTEIDGMFKQLTRSISTAVYGTGSGSIGKVATSGITTVTLTLSDIEQIVNFDVDMIVSASSADASGARVGTAQITGIDRDLGTLTTGSNWTSQITSITDGDFLQVSGDLAAKVTGLGGWIPSSAPGATAFFGVDRSVEKTRLGGVRVPSSVAPAGIAIEEKIMRSVARVAREGGKPDRFILNFAQFANLQASLGTRVQYGEVQTADGEYGFRSIQITCGTSVVDVLADAYCDSATGWVLQTDTWKLYSLGEVPRFENSDGLTMLRQTTNDGVEVRAKYYAQLGCVAPGYNGRVAL